MLLPTLSSPAVPGSLAADCSAPKARHTLLRSIASVLASVFVAWVIPISICLQHGLESTMNNEQRFTIAVSQGLGGWLVSEPTTREDNTHYGQQISNEHKRTIAACTNADAAMLVKLVNWALEHYPFADPTSNKVVAGIRSFLVQPDVDPSKAGALVTSLCSQSTMFAIHCDLRARRKRDGLTVVNIAERCSLSMAVVLPMTHGCWDNIRLGELYKFMHAHGHVSATTAFDSVEVTSTEPETTAPAVTMSCNSCGYEGAETDFGPAGYRCCWSCKSTDVFVKDIHGEEEPSSA